jgi:hypothetical protein
MMDRLNVRNILRRKKFKLQGNNYSCVLCAANCEETTFHLFCACCFAQACWSRLGIHWNFSLPFHPMMEQAQNQTPRRFFMELFILAAWTIWKQRNDFIFNRAVPSFSSWERSFFNESLLQSTRMKHDLAASFVSLIEMYR